MKMQQPVTGLFGLCLLSWHAFGSIPAFGQTIWDANPTADTFITSATRNGTSPDSNFGSFGAITVAGSGSGNGGEYIALLKFNTAAAVSTFDAAYGSGNWTITSATLRLAGNFATQDAQPNNLRFPPISAGAFSISWFSDDSWSETGVTYNNFAPSGTNTSLGSFTYTPPGNNVPLIWALGLAPSFLSDIAAGGSASLRLDPADSTVSYLFNSRTYNTSANFPLLTITAIPEPVTGSVFLLAAGLSLLCHRRLIRKH